MEVGAESRASPNCSLLVTIPVPFVENGGFLCPHPASSMRGLGEHCLHLSEPCRAALDLFLRALAG